MNEEEKKKIEKFVEKCNKFDESVEIKGVSSPFANFVIKSVQDVTKTGVLSTPLLVTPIIAATEALACATDCEPDFTSSIYTSGA